MTIIPNPPSGDSHPELTLSIDNYVSLVTELTSPPSDPGTEAKKKSSVSVPELAARVLNQRDKTRHYLKIAKDQEVTINYDKLKSLYEADKRLRTWSTNEIGRKVSWTGVRKQRSNPQVPTDEEWWWYLDNILFETSVVTRWGISLLVYSISIILILIGFILTVLLGQRLAILDSQVFATFAAASQVAFGGGASIVLRRVTTGNSVQRLVDIFQQFNIPISKNGLTRLLASMIFLGATMIFFFYGTLFAGAVYKFAGDRALDGDNIAAAETYFENAALLDTNRYSDDFAAVGCRYLELGAPQKAQSIFERAIEIDSTLIRPRYFLSKRYIAQNDRISDAIEIAQNGLSLNYRNEFDEYLLNLTIGQAYLTTGDYERAQKYLGAGHNMILKKFDGQLTWAWAEQRAPIPCFPQLENTDLENADGASLCKSGTGNVEACGLVGITTVELQVWLAESFIGNARDDLESLEINDLCNAAALHSLVNGSDFRDLSDLDLESYNLRTLCISNTNETHFDLCKQQWQLRNRGTESLSNERCQWNPKEIVGLETDQLGSQP